MSDRYSVVLTRCMALSAAGLATSLLGILPPWVPFLAAMLPLVWYHQFYLRRFAGEGISQPAVDSVYYYGFLVTIGALGVSALELAIKGVEGDLTQVAFQFGLGLLATGYAVWARVQLTASSTLLDEANLEEAMNRYVERSRELVSSVELATASFSNYATTVIDKSEQFRLRVEAQTQASINAAASELRDAVASMAEESRLALVDLRGVINDTTFGAEREALRSSVISMVETVNALSNSLTELKTNSSTSSAAVGALAGGLGEVGTKAASLVSTLEQLGSKDGALQSLGDAAALGKERINELALCADLAAVSTTSLADRLSASGEGIEALTTATKKGTAAIAKLDAGNHSIDRFTSQIAEVAASLNATAKSATSSQASFDGLDTRLTELRETLQHLNDAIIDATGGLKDSMIATSDALEKNLTLALERTERLASSLQSELMSGTLLLSEEANGAS